MTQAWQTALTKASRHLSRKDPLLKPIVKRVGPCTLQLSTASFATLARSILAQQISGSAARSIGARVEALLGPKGWTSAALLKLDVDTLRGAGVSSAKARYLLDLADKTQQGELQFERLPELSDEEVIAHLLPVKGIGRWTAQMFLMFSLGRLDVLPVDDLGLKLGVQALHNYPEIPGKTEIEALAEPWRPYRSIATWYLWRSRGPVPQSE